MERYTTDPDINKLIQKYVDRGWVFKRCGKHPKLYRPDSDQHFVSIPCTPSDSKRAILNLTRDIKRVEKR